MTTLLVSKAFSEKVTAYNDSLLALKLIAKSSPDPIVPELDEDEELDDVVGVQLPL